MKAIITADWHLRSTVPRCRKNEDWVGTQKRLLQFIANESNKRKCPVFIVLYIIRKMIYIIRYKNATAGTFLNKTRRGIESLLERITVPRCYEDLPVRSNKDFCFNTKWLVTST